jgi:hypothetical protein
VVGGSMQTNNIQNATISATIIRKDGTREELGVICEINNNKTILNKLKKMLGGKKNGR